MKNILCRRCNSAKIIGSKKGFSTGKAAIGFSIFGVAGLLGGGAGSEKIQITCLSCGYSWGANEDEKNTLLKSGQMLR